MPTPLDRPDGPGMSRAKLAALAVMAVPVIQRYLEARGWQVDDQVVRDILIGLGALVAWYLRSAMKRPAAQSLGPLLDSYRKAFEDRARLQARIHELETRELQENEAAHG